MAKLQRSGSGLKQSLLKDTLITGTQPQTVSVWIWKCTEYANVFKCFCLCFYTVCVCVSACMHVCVYTWYMFVCVCKSSERGWGGVEEVKCWSGRDTDDRFSLLDCLVFDSYEKHVDLCNQSVFFVQPAGHPSVLCGKYLNFGHYLQNSQLNSFSPVMHIGITDLNYFALRLVALTFMFSYQMFGK